MEVLISQESNRKLYSVIKKQITLTEQKGKNCKMII